MALYKQSYVARYGVTTKAGDANIAGNVISTGNVTGTGNGTFGGNGYFGGTSYLGFPAGSTAQRPVSPSAGMVRYNTDLSAFEGWFGTAWGSLANSTIVPLQKPLNLSDVPDIVAARANLQVYSTAQVYTQAQTFSQAQVNNLFTFHLPPGTLMHFSGTAATGGWLPCNGAAVSRTTYAALFAQVGTLFGAGDGTTTFTLPDLRGAFLRGWDAGRGFDVGRTLGSYQADAFASHTHSAGSDNQGVHSHTGYTDAQGVHAHGGATAAAGNHAHGGGTDGQGSHSHGGSTTAVGDHQHSLPYLGSVQAGSDNGGAQSPVGTGYGSDRGQQAVNPAGGHNHAIGTDVQGFHGHNIGTDVQGNHAHTIATDAQGSHAHNIQTYNSVAHYHNITVYANGGAETRPKNYAFLICIKY